MALPARAEERLETLARQIDVLAATAQAGTQENEAAIQRRVAVLRNSEASARAAAREAAASIEESVRGLDTRITIAEQAAAVELAEDQDQFLGAVKAELRSWDVHLERLQVNVATTAGDGRNQAEGAIRELRRRRNALGAHLAEMSSTSGEAWREVRDRVRAARNELDSRAAELEAALQKGGDELRRRVDPCTDGREREVQL